MEIACCRMEKEDIASAEKFLQNAIALPSTNMHQADMKFVRVQLDLKQSNFCNAQSDFQKMRQAVHEYEKKGDKTSHSEIVRALKERDELDMKRAYAPLRKADDAVVIDTTGKPVDEVVNMILKLVPKEYLKAPAISVSD
jgi:cytidylate kinase